MTLELPMTLASKTVLDRAEQRFQSCPGGRPDVMVDFGAILVLASFGETSALVQLGRLGFPEFTFSEERKWRLLHWYASTEGLEESIRVAQRHGPGDEMGPRVSSLWGSLEERRERMRMDCAALQRRIQPMLPDDLALDNHQLEALVLFERWKHRMLLADDMGLGKTVMALGTLLLTDAFPAFVVCPASVVYTWAREAKKWLGRLGVEAYPVERGFKASSVTAPRAVVVASYEQMVGYQRELQFLRPAAFMADESHYLMRWESQRTLTAVRLRSKASHRLLLSGTPMPNGRHREIYPQVKIIDGDAFKFLDPKKADRKVFLRRFCDPKTQHFGKKRITSYDGRSNEAELGRILQGFMLRRTKAEAGIELPEKTRNAIEVPLKLKDQLALAKMKDDVARKVRAKADELREELEIKGYPADIIEDKVKAVLGAKAVTELAEMHSRLGIVKADWSVRRIREHLDAGHRVLVAAYHHKVAHHAQEVYSKSFGADRVRMATGALAGRARQRFLDKIEPSPGVRGEGDLVILTRAYREGLTLTSFTRGVMLQRWWVPGEESQMEDRIYRRGQTRDVVWDYLIVQGSLDDSMADLITWKERGQQQSYGSMEMRTLAWLVPELAE
jgi:SWI/SNF-related matrix-associated actin-dependent regulator 1 of chromatin subfamily A